MLFNLEEKRLIKEALSGANIYDAIDSHCRVAVNYDNGSGAGTGKRIVGFFAYGLTSQNNPAVRVYEYVGDSRSGITPGWKLFIVDNIRSFKILRHSHIDKPPIGFNPRGDRGFFKTFKVADYGMGTPEGFGKEDGKPQSPADARTGVFKTEGDKDLDALRSLGRRISRAPVITVDGQKARGVYKTDTERRAKELLDKIKSGKIETLDDYKKKMADARASEEKPDVKIPETPVTVNGKTPDSLYTTDTERRTRDLLDRLRSGKVETIGDYNKKIGQAKTTGEREEALATLRDEEKRVREL